MFTTKIILYYFIK